MTIAVTGAAGHLGRLAIRKLKKNVPETGIVALVRNPAKAADLGVAVREADYSKPETLTKALAGIDRLLLISSSEVGKRIAQHRNVIAAAKNAGAKLIVYTSVLHADKSTSSVVAEDRATEAELKTTGIPFVILLNGYYTENYTVSIGGALASGVYIGCVGDGRISLAPREDYAEAAAAVLTGEGHAGKVYELAGDEGYTLADLAAELSKQVGRNIPYKNLSEADFVKVLVGVGLPENLAAVYAGLDIGASRGAMFDDSRQLSKLIGRPTTPLATSIAAALKH